MSHGYHFTTWEAYRCIKQNGLELGPLTRRPELRAIEKYLSNGGIWLYRKPMTGHKLLGMLIYVAVNHGSDRIVLLRVEYDAWQAASCCAERDMADGSTVNLIHDFDGAGHYGHEKEPFEVLIAPVAPDRIRPLARWNLVDILMQHPRTKKASTLPLPSLSTAR
jgi:hypothetical protein